MLSPRSVALVSWVLCCGCSGDPAGPASSPPACEEGGGEACADFTPPRCDAGSMLVFGLGDCQPVGWNECGEGFVPDPSGWGCREVLPAVPCPAGTMARLGHGECEPVGWTSCPPGFEPHASGWGCDAVVTDAPCVGATHAKLGSHVCQPIGDCSAPFPPAGATIFVDDDYADDEIDATHFADISSALFAAQTGEVIAIEAGEYPESLQLHKNVTLRGRCAEEVIVEGTTELYPGIWAQSTVTTSISGVTLRGFPTGVMAEAGAQMELEEIVVEGSRTSGVSANYEATVVAVRESVIRSTSTGFDFQQPCAAQAIYGARLELYGTDVVDNVYAGACSLGGGQVYLEDSIVRDTRDWQGSSPYALTVFDASVTTLVRSALVHNYQFAGYVGGSGARLELRDSVVRDTYGADPRAPADVYGIYVSYGAQLDVLSSALRDSPPMSVDGAALIDVSDSVIGGPPTQWGQMSLFLHRSVLLTEGTTVSGSGSTLVLENSLVRSPESGPAQGGGVHVAAMAFLQVTESTIEGTHDWGLLVEDPPPNTPPSVAGSLIRNVVPRETVPDVPAGSTRGIGVEAGGYLTVNNTALVDNAQLGVLVSGDPMIPSTLSGTNVLVRGTSAPDDPDLPSAGVAVRGGAAVTLTGLSAVDNEAVGILVEDPGANAAISNAVALGTRPSAAGSAARAVRVVSGGRATLQSTAIVDTQGVGLAAADLGTTIAGNRLLVTGTHAPGDTSESRGIVLEAGAQAELAESSVVQSDSVAVQVAGAFSTAKLSGFVLGEVGAAPGVTATFGGVAQDGGRLVLDRCRVFGSAGVGLAFFAAPGAVETCIFDHNAVALHAQDGSAFVDEENGASSLSVLLSNNNHFVGNGERIGTAVFEPPEVLESK